MGFLCSGRESHLHSVLEIIGKDSVNSGCIESPVLRLRLDVVKYYSTRWMTVIGDFIKTGPTRSQEYSEDTRKLGGKEWLFIY